MEFCFRMDPDSLNNYTRIVDNALEGAEPSWALLRQTMEQAMQLEFPKKRSERHRSTEGLWMYRRTLRSLPEVLLALADLHRQLKQRMVWRTWAAVARQSATARHAKRRKFEQRQQLIDEQLAQAEAKSSKDGSHSLYKVIRSFKTGKPHERVQLRDEQGRFLTMQEERKALEDYSKDLFGTGEDFQLTGASGSLGITPSEVMDQLRSIKVGKADERAKYPDRQVEAFDMVDRRRLRESLELANADPYLIDLVGKLHIQALYDMTASDQAFSIATRRGIKQGCKLAPSLFAFATFLLFRRLGAQCDLAALQKILTMYADDTLLQMHFDDKQQLQEALQLCDLLLDQLMELGFKVNPEKSALLLQIHGGSAQQIRQGLLTTKQGEKFVQLPSGRLIALKSQVAYLGIIISYQDYEMKSLRHRLQASKAALKEVAHAVRNSRAVTEKRRLSIWRITAWASATYGLHVVGLTPQGLSQLESHMIFQLRFVLRSYSQETHETNQQFMQRKGFKTAKFLALKHPHARELPFCYRTRTMTRYVGEGKNSNPIRLQETLSLPVFEAEGSDITWHPFSLRNAYLLLLELQQACGKRLVAVAMSLEDFFRNDDLVNAVARLVLRHDEQLLALTSDLCFVSYVRTEGLGDVIARLEADSTQVTMFKTSRPLSDKMTG
ncbi:unnamed protein product, partial [Symbiodinium microadriaticum]